MKIDLRESNRSEYLKHENRLNLWSKTSQQRKTQDQLFSLFGKRLTTIHLKIISNSQKLKMREV
jgi:hypothetical protein